MYFDNLPNINIHYNGGMLDITYTKDDIIYCVLPGSILPFIQSMKFKRKWYDEATLK